MRIVDRKTAIPIQYDYPFDKRDPKKKYNEHQIMVPKSESTLPICYLIKIIDYIYIYIFVQ